MLSESEVTLIFHYEEHREPRRKKAGFTLPAPEIRWPGSKRSTSKGSILSGSVGQEKAAVVPIIPLEARKRRIFEMSDCVQIKKQTSGRRIPRYTRFCPCGQPTVIPAHVCLIYNTTNNLIKSRHFLIFYNFPTRRRLPVVLVLRINLVENSPRMSVESANKDT
jgi:hypothetical protein